MTVKIVSEVAVAKLFFFNGVRRCWYVDNYIDQIAESYTLWSVAASSKKDKTPRLTFEQLDDWRRFNKLSQDHREDIFEYADRIDHGELVLPPILVQLKPSGIRVVWDGNRRCAAWMFEQRANVVMPAYVLDYRSNPF